MSVAEAGLMPFAVYDYRTDVRNVLVTPEIRGRFLRMEPGEVGPFHSHDVGLEVFLVLEGRAEFEIEGQTAVVGPGQMCIARAGEKHEVRVIGDEPMTLFLSVTPHLEPTHTFWDELGRRLPPRYGFWTPAGFADQPLPAESMPILARRHAEATGELADAVGVQREAQSAAVVALDRAVAAGDGAAAREAVDALWSEMRRTYERFRALEATWNDLALRLGSEQNGA